MKIVSSSEKLDLKIGLSQVLAQKEKSMEIAYLTPGLSFTVIVLARSFSHRHDLNISHVYDLHCMLIILTYNVVLLTAELQSKT